MAEEGIDSGGGTLPGGRLETLQRLLAAALWDWEPPDDAFQASAPFLGILGLEAGRTPSWPQVLARIHPQDRAPLQRALELSACEGRAFQLDTRLPGHPRERILHWRAEGEMDAAGCTRRVTGTLQDVTRVRRSERQIRFLAYHDGLTGLLNRAAFLEHLRRTLLLQRRHGGNGALLFVDLDDFKRINDLRGHLVGDALLREVARRLDGCLRATDLLARTRGSGPDHVSRVGGDEFSALLARVTRPEDAARVARRLLQATSEPFWIDGDELCIGASIGIALFPADGLDPLELLRKADQAMYQAKQSGRGRYCFFTEMAQSAASRRLDLERRLCRAVEQGELELHYQPQVCARSGRLVGVEALLRWSPDGLGPVPPSEFVPVAEDCGLIVTIGERVLEQVCAQARAWHEAGLPDLRFAVNVAALHFTGGALVERLSQTLFDAGLAPSRLELEITESAFMQNQEAALAAARELKRLGVSLALDDFGTGYSSLSHLRHFPVDALKIDRSFVRDVCVDPQDGAITAAILSMARTLGLRTVAEGVEDEAQRAFLRARGCDEMQGYLFGAAVPAWQIVERLVDGAEPSAPGAPGAVRGRRGGDVRVARSR